MKTVADGVAGRGERGDAGQKFLVVLDEHDAVAHRHQVLAGVEDEVLQRAAELAFIGPEIKIALGDVDLRVREQRLVVGADKTADVVDMRMRAHHRVDIGGLDAGCRHVLLLLAGGRAERLRGAHAGVEQDQSVAGVHEWRVLLQHDIVRD